VPPPPNSTPGDGSRVDGIPRPARIQQFQADFVGRIAGQSALMGPSVSAIGGQAAPRVPFQTSPERRSAAWQRRREDRPRERSHRILDPVKRLKKQIAKWNASSRESERKGGRARPSGAV